MSVVASLVSLLVKDSVLAFIHDHKLKVEVTDHAVDQLFVSVKHDVAVNVIKCSITCSTSRSFSFLEERLSRLQATSSKFLGLELRATHKLNLTHRWSTGDCLVVNTQVFAIRGN